MANTCFHCDRPSIGRSTVGSKMELCSSHFDLAMVAGWKPEIHKTLPVSEPVMTAYKFASLMEAELKANAHKGDWSSWNPEPKRLIDELNHHVSKLVAALVFMQGAAAVTEHAADIGNICMKAVERFGEVPAEVR